MVTDYLTFVLYKSIIHISDFSQATVCTVFVLFSDDKQKELFHVAYLKNASGSIPLCLASCAR